MIINKNIISILITFFKKFKKSNELIVFIDLCDYV